jgi:hypothetical protein
MIKNKKTTRELSQEFFTSVKARSSYNGEASYSYMTGYLQSFIEGLADLPAVRREMEKHVHDFLMEMNRENSRLVSSK